MFCDILRVCDEQDLPGGTVFAVDGLKLPSNASKQWSGTFEDLKRKQEKLEAKVARLLAEHQDADSQAYGSASVTDELAGEELAEEELTSKKQKSKKQKRAERLKRLRRQAARINDWLETHEPKIGKQGRIYRNSFCKWG